MKVEVAILGLPSLIVLMVSVDVKQHYNPPQYNNPLLILKKKIQLLVDSTEAQSTGTVEETVLGSPSLIVFMVSVDVKQHGTRTPKNIYFILHRE